MQTQLRTAKDLLLVAIAAEQDSQIATQMGLETPVERRERVGREAALDALSDPPLWVDSE